MEFSSENKEPKASGSGTTANVSAGGVYFVTSDWQGLTQGQNVDLQLSGLSAYNLGPPFRSLRGRATVLRLDAPEAKGTPYAKAGVAVRFDERPRVDVYRFSP